MFFVMVKLQESKGVYFLSVPKAKVKLKKWEKGQEFDVQFDHNGNMVFVAIS